MRAAAMAQSKKERTLFVCQECGVESLRWQGRCPECNAWNTFVERTVRPQPATKARTATGADVVEVSALSGDAHPRLQLGISEFDRVLGGGVVPGSIMLIGGDPGIGKTTLLLQALPRLASTAERVLYVSGEESPQQIKMRGERLNVPTEALYILAETA